MRYVLAVFLWLGVTATAQAASDAGLGRAIAIEACSACHQVMPHQKQPDPVPNPDEGISIAAPDFSSIARKYASRPRALRSYIAAPVHPMREQMWIPEDLDAVVAFIGTIAR
jgi:mono/diheme cytochrome c family protein